MRTVDLVSDEEFLEVAREHAPTIASMWEGRGHTDTQLVQWDGGRNYCQIQRDAWSGTEDRTRKLAEHIRLLEVILLHGKADFDTSGTQPVAYSGGLGDLGIDAGGAQLLFMRGPIEIASGDDEGSKSEFLSEFTVAPRERVTA